MTTSFDEQFIAAMLRDARIYRQNHKNSILLDEERIASWVNRIYVIACLHFTDHDPFLNELKAMDDHFGQRKTDAMRASRVQIARREAGRIQEAAQIIGQSLGVIEDQLDDEAGSPIARQVASSQRFTDALFGAARSIGNTVDKKHVIQDEDEGE